jgi:hypothetical protein
MVMKLMNAVIEIMTLVEIVKNPVPMKIMMREIIRRMVVMKKKKMMSRIKTSKQTVMEIEQTVMEMMTNQGKTVELMVVERRIAVM